MTDTTTLPKVIIVGGGYAGTHAAMKLHNSGVQMNLTFITTCTHLNVNFGNVRAAVTETFHHRIFAPYENMFQTPRDDRHIVTGKGYLLLDSGERHDFDHLLICTGSSYTSPFKFSYKTPEEAKAELAIICKAIQSAKSILIIGGGPTACEFAAEIQTESMDKNKAYDKTVTIVTSGDKILHGDPTAKDKLRVKLLGQMVKQKIDIVYNERVVIPDSLASGYCLSPMKVTTEKGKEFEADCVFKTIGNAKFNSGLITSLVEELGLENSEAMNEKGQIKVKATGVLAFGDITNIYAVGDVSTLDERNQYMTGIAGGECASLNIINAIRGKPMADYKRPKDDIILVALGRNGGAGQMPMGLFIGSVLTPMIKSKDFFTTKMFTLLNSLKPVDP